jgi:hypothetical protein
MLLDRGNTIKLELLYERIKMARKPNYKFERMERDRNKAAKKEARLKAKQEKAELRKAAVLAGEEFPSGPPLDDFPENSDRIDDE